MPEALRYVWLVACRVGVCVCVCVCARVLSNNGLIVWFLHKCVCVCDSSRMIPNIPVSLQKGA